MTDAETLREQAEAAARWLMRSRIFSINNVTADYPEKKVCGFWFVRELYVNEDVVSYLTNAELIKLAKEQGWTPNA